MTDIATTAAERPVMIGPLTANQWALLFTDDDPRNPLPPCCPDLAEVRDALADVFRAGGDPQLCGWQVATVWPIVTAHLDDEQISADPILSRLRTAYVAGREHYSDDREGALARMTARTLDDVQKYIDLIGADHVGGWDLGTPEGRMRALARIGGGFVCFIDDDDQRREASRRLADKIGMDGELTCFAVDVLRLTNGLPYRKTHQWISDFR